MLNIIPKPKYVVEKEGYFVLDGDTPLWADKQFEPVARQFDKIVSACTGFHLKTGKGGVNFAYESSFIPEQYEVVVNSQGINVKSKDLVGAFYAVETLRQLLEVDISKDMSLMSPCCVIQDQPKYKWRGLSLDITRHFFDKREIYRLLDQMGRVKLNVLHLHISDDQGFRVQIDKYPKLNEIGSYRDATLIRNGRRHFENQRYGGYLTKLDVRDIVDYARRRQIAIVPELDIPGHTTAIIAAYPELSCEGSATKVRTRFGISDNILCAGNQEVYEFLFDVLDEICDMFPTRYIHIGGDEAPKRKWRVCPKCNAKMEELGYVEYSELQGHMINAVTEHLRKRNKRAIIWNDGLSSNVNSDVIVQHWTQSIMSQKGTVDYLNKGGKGIISKFDYTYFDYPYAMTPLSKTYRFEPRLAGLDQTGTDNIMGCECNVWTEHIRNREKLDFNLYPRMLAFAENCWSAELDDYDNFISRVRQYYKIYDNLGVGYAKDKEHRGTNWFTTLRFFAQDANIELYTQNRHYKSTAQYGYGETVPSRRQENTQNVAPNRPNNKVNNAPNRPDNKANNTPNRTENKTNNAPNRDRQRQGGANSVQQTNNAQTAGNAQAQPQDGQGQNTPKQQRNNNHNRYRSNRRNHNNDSQSKKE